MFLEQQIRLLEWFLKNHVTLKTGRWKFSLDHRNKLHFTVYSNKNSDIKLQYYFTILLFLYFWSNICRLSEQKRFSKTIQNFTDRKLWKGSVIHSRHELVHSLTHLFISSLSRMSDSGQMNTWKHRGTDGWMDEYERLLERREIVSEECVWPTPRKMLLDESKPAA